MEQVPADENAVKLSVVIPLFNKRETIRRAIDSVLGQSFPAMDVIVVDDGSTDGSDIEVSSLSDSRITLIRQSNQGVSVARNVGAERARSEFVCFLDADDEWHPNFLKQIADLVSLEPEAGIYCCRYETITPDGRLALGELDLSPHHYGTVSNFYRVYRCSRSFLNSSNVCVRKEVLQSIGGFPAGERIGEDVYVWLKLAQECRVLFDARVSSRIHQDAANRTVDRFPPDVPFYLRAYLQDERLPSDPELRALLRSFCLIYAATAIKRGHRHMAHDYSKLVRRIDVKAAVLCKIMAYCPSFIFSIAERLRHEHRILNSTLRRT